MRVKEQSISVSFELLIWRSISLVIKDLDCPQSTTGSSRPLQFLYVRIVCYSLGHKIKE